MLKMNAQEMQQVAGGSDLTSQAISAETTLRPTNTLRSKTSEVKLAPATQALAEAAISMVRRMPQGTQIGR